ncbi:MAG TPA: hypothetical protein VKD67_03460 [Acidimicrobiales bacterium]|nr:hypothetical protein [Acidimicrobiales bacterium]
MGRKLVTALGISISLATAAPAVLAVAEPAQAADRSVAAEAPAPLFWDSQSHLRAGGSADRFEVDQAARMTGLSTWYHLSYVTGSDQLQVHDRNRPTTTTADSAIAKSQKVAWHVATSLVAGASGDLPKWARARTGNADGTSAGLLFALAHLDLLTAGPLAGSLRVAATGSIGSDGTVTAVRMVDAKVAAARLAGADVVFAPDFPAGTGAVTSVPSHVGRPAADGPIGDWLNTAGFEAAGRAATAGSAALVQVDDVRQALAWLCGRTGRADTCSLAHAAAARPFSSARPGLGGHAPDANETSRETAR